jgi:hypothetical protein
VRKGSGTFELTCRENPRRMTFLMWTTARGSAYETTGQ